MILVHSAGMLRFLTWPVSVKKLVRQRNGCYEKLLANELLLYVLEIESCDKV
jgi:hypothetical protein